MSGFETSFQQAFLVFFWCELGFGYLCNKPLLFLYEMDLGTPETKPNQNTFSNPSQPDQSPSCQSHRASIIVYLLLSTPLSFFFFSCGKNIFQITLWPSWHVFVVWNHRSILDSWRQSSVNASRASIYYRRRNLCVLLDYSPSYSQGPGRLMSLWFLHMQIRQALNSSNQLHGVFLLCVAALFNSE